MKKPIKVQPLGNRVIIFAPDAKKENKETRVGAIIIPEVASNASRASLVNPYLTAKVLAVGEACKVAWPGQRVVVAKSDCWVVTVDGVEHAFIREEAIVAMLS